MRGLGSAPPTPDATVQSLSQGITHMMHATKPRATAMIGGAVVAALFAFAAPLGWSQVGAISAGAPTSAAATAPATGSAPAASGDVPTATAPAHHGVYFATDNSGAQELVPNIFKREGKDPNFVREMPALANFDALTFSPPLPLYSLSAADIASASPPQTPGLTVYLALAKGQMVSFLEMAADASGKLAVRSSGNGSNYGAIMKTIDALKTNPTIQKGAYEARILSTFYLGGFNGPQNLLWLKADPGGTDLFVVTGGTNFERGKLYDAPAFFKILADNMAKQQANPPADATPGATSGAMPLRHVTLSGMSLGNSFRSYSDVKALRQAQGKPTPGL